MSSMMTDRKKEESVLLKYNGSFPIHDAATAGDTDAVLLLSNRRDVNAYDEVGRLPLHMAAMRGHVNVVDCLLQHEADVNTPERSTGRSALHHACLAGHVTVIGTLLKNGAVVYDQDKNGAYPLHLAAEGGHCGPVDLLMSAGATISEDKNGSQAVHYAARYDHPAVLDTLYTHGADLEARDMAGATPMHYAAKYDRSSAIRKLHELGAFLDSTCKLGDAAIHYATKAEVPGAIATLAELGADLNMRNNEHECAIHVGARLNHWQSVRQLIKSGQDIDVTYMKRAQAIHIAAQYGCCDVIKILATLRADLNADDKHGNRPLHYAVRADQLDALQKLVEFGADINATGKRGQTAVLVAAKEKRTQAVHILGSLGADCNIEDQAALYPVYYACLNEDPYTAKYLIRNGAGLSRWNSEGEAMIHVMTEEGKLEGLTTMKELRANLSLHNKAGDTCMHMAAAERQIQVLKHLRNLRADLDMTNKNGMSALNVAVMKGDGDQVDLLHDIGADLNARSKDFERFVDTPALCRSEWPPSDISREDYWIIKTGMAPVHLALLYEHRDVFDFIVTCGADINQTNDDGENVVHLAVLFNMTDWLQTLITQGADRNCKDKIGRTPLHYAAHTGNIQALRLLLKYGAIITEADDEGRQPLHYAAQAGHYLLLPEFTGVNRPVDINCKDKNGLTPLIFACANGKLETILELVGLGADINNKDENGNTALHVAATKGCHTILVLLTGLGCRVDELNKDLRTPFYLAGEHGQGEAMEYLLMCGCNPSLRDKNDQSPSTYKLSGPVKRSVGRRIKEYHDHMSSKHHAGEICYESKMVRSGKTFEFVKLGMTVTVRSRTPVSPIVFLHRTPADAAYLDIPLSGLEDILSDVYELRILNLDTEGDVMLEIPLDGYPGRFESCIRTTENIEFEEFTTSEENGVPVFVGVVPIRSGTIHKFAVVVRPRKYQYSIGADGGTIISDIYRQVRIEVPSGAFQNNTNLNVQILKTDDIERTKSDSVFATDIINVTTDGTQPSNKVQLQLPLHDVTDDPNDVMVFMVQEEEDIYDERKWAVVQSHWKIMNNCVSFSVSHFSVYLAIKASVCDRFALDAKKRRAKDTIKSALQRETSVVFFYASCKKKGAFLTILECTTPGRFQRRSEFWVNEGFQLHPQIRHSGHFPAKPNQVFHFNITGNLQFVGKSSKNLSLTFNPRSYKYHSFYLTKVDKKVPLIAEIEVMTAPSDISSTKRSDEETVLTSIPIEIPVTSTCVLA